MASVASNVAARRLERVRQRGGGAAQSQSHIVFLQMAAFGHVQPIVPLIAALCARGDTVTLFAAPGIEDDAAAAVKAAGATVLNYRETPCDDLPQATSQRESVVRTELCWLPALLQELASLQPSLIVYDAFITIGPLVGTLTGVPCVGVIPHCGPGWLASVDDGAAATAELASASSWLAQRYSINLLAHGSPPLGWWRNNTGLNLVLTVSELWCPPSTDAQRRACEGLKFECIGTLLHVAARPLPSLATRSFPIDAVRDAKAAGRMVVYLSLGTLVTGAFWTQLPADAQGSASVQSARTGQAISHRVWSAAFEALGRASNVLLVIAVGRRDGAMRGLPPLPANCLACSLVPQLDILPLCTVFITHAGMGSVMEAILHQVPLVAIPICADQPANADAIHRAGLGVKVRPDELTPTALAAAVRHVGAPDSPCRRAVAAVAARMRAEGGVSRAVALLVSAVARGQASRVVEARGHVTSHLGGVGAGRAALVTLMAPQPVAMVRG